MDTNSSERRWDTDEIGHGVADGTAYAPGVQRLLDALQQPDWIAEDPDVHLLPHLQQACAEETSPWTLVSTVFSEGMYQVTLDWRRRNANYARLRADIFSIVGAIAEGVTYVHQQVTADSISYEVVTGLLDGDTQWRGHGHLVHFRVEGDAVRNLLGLMTHADDQDQLVKE